MRPIRNSAKAIIVREHQVLLTKNKDNFGFFYLFPGGGQEAGETLSAAVRRECMEEIGADVRVLDLVHIREYIGKNHEFAEWDGDIHQVEFYFMCELADHQAVLANGINPDAYQVGVEWVDVAKLTQIRVYPQTLGPIIQDRNPSRVYIGDVN